MKYFFKKITRFALASKLLTVLVAVICFAGCTDEDRDHCFTDLSLRFTYTHNSLFVDLFDAQVQSLDLYFYDHQDRLLGKRRVMREQLESRNTYSLRDLPLDEYTIVAWGNYDPAFYSCNEAYTLSDMSMDVLCADDGALSGNPCHFFHGIARVGWGDTGELVVPMIKTTNDIHIEIVQTTRADDDFSVRMEGIAGSYNYENNQVGDGLLHHTPGCVESGGRHRADFTVTRLREGDGLSVVIMDDQGDVLHTDLVTARILAEYPLVNNNSDLDRYDDYTLVYRAQSTGGTYVFTLIQINDWDLTGSGGGI